MAFSFLPFILFLSNLLCPAISQESNSSSLKTYIVHVQQPPGAATFSSFKDKEKWYMSFFPAETASLRESRMIYSYSNVISGFAARLTDEELSHMKNKSGFTDAYLDRILPLQTTHTPSFLGLHRDAPGLWNDSNYGRGVIIGVLDSGIAANHASFSDEGMPSPPARWKGYCEFNASDCNKKLIGAREFLTGTKAMQTATDRMTPRGTTNDTNGHGTHTASTAAGMFVNNASVNGLANGTASGLAPYAHLAIYKVCAGDGTCAESDTLAGMDAAVEDGVDLMSLSIGGSSTPFYQDSMAIGAFGAIQKGILVSCAAGNDGPDHGTLSNEAPWILTVGASTMDRLIQTTVTLGDNDEINGESAYQPSNKFSSTPLPLIYPGILGGRRAGFCANSSLDGIDVRGKMVVCDDGLIDKVSKDEIVKDAGGLGMIVANPLFESFTTFSDAHVLPASHVSYSDGQRIKAYINSASAPNASITFKGTLLGTKPAPAVAYFSSRGPSQADPNILKPDIIGPGLNVLAAWPFQVGAPTGTGARFNIISGTSMATPHLSGIAALLKSMHPDWSPAAIKSAIMTTASLTANDGYPITDETSNPTDFFGIGAGHVNVLKASNPGLVYDIKPRDYLAYLCGLGYTDRQVSIIARRAARCSNVGSMAGKDLNYPSFMVFLNATNNYTVEVTRMVTNVGTPSSTYTAQSRASEGVKVDVKPTVLSFTKANDRLRYNVTFSSSGTSGGKYFQGYLTWISSDSNATVGSPIVIAVV